MEDVLIDKNKVKYIDRQTAAKLMNVSTRTLDRYLRKSKLKSIKRNHRIYVKKNDIDGYINKYKVDECVSQVSQTDVTDNLFKNYPEDTKLDALQNTDDKQLVQLCKNLYLEFKKDIEQKNEKLQSANYKIGKLETEISQMVPIIDKKKSDYEYRTKVKEYENNVKSLEKENIKLNTLLYQEKINKIIYIIILSAVLITAPLLFVFGVFG